MSFNICERETSYFLIKLSHLIRHTGDTENLYLKSVLVMMMVVNWLFNVTINDISVIYVTAHRCAGALKKK